MDDVTALRDARRLLRHLDDKHWPTTRPKRPGFLVCDFDSMTWPCDTRKALSLIAAVEARAALTPERLAKALHATGLNTIGKKPGSHGRFTRQCICNMDARAILAAINTMEGSEDEEAARRYFALLREAKRVIDGATTAVVEVDKANGAAGPAASGSEGGTDHG